LTPNGSVLATTALYLPNPKQLTFINLGCTIREWNIL
jgi:hypothetical protein